MTLAPLWVDPGEVTGFITPFWVLYAIHDALVKPMPGNLTRLQNQGELSQKLEEIQAYRGKTRIPVVFWDEFDCQLAGRDLGWLVHLIAPMYSDKFGEAISVFAGGTRATWEDFETVVSKQPSATKANDFRTRIECRLDIPLLDSREDGWDNFTLIRRAILLRSMLERRAGHLVQTVNGSAVMQVDPHVAHAFLQIPKYKSGARSLEHIIEIRIPMTSR